MKKIIYVFLLMGIGLSAQSNLLFKTDFENTVVLGQIVGDYKFFSGSSLGYTFPEDDYFDIWGTSHSGIHMIDGDGGSGDDITNVTALLERTTGHLGTSTTALHTKIIKQGAGSTQVTWQFNNFTTDPDEFYMKCWQKVDMNFVVNQLGWRYNWRTLWQYKTQNFYKNDGSGARLSLYAMQFGEDEEGNPIYFWRLTLDNQVVTTSNEATAIVWQVDSNPTTMPRDEWFKLEVYFKYRTDNTGEAWVKINGKTEVHAINVPMTVINPATGEYDPFKFILGNSLYGEDDGMEQWLDDIEIWDGLPNEDSDPDLGFANAGSDQAICQGESVTLTASGGSKYKWSTGATTQSITVTPTETTTYSVEVSEGSAKDTDEVKVTVNNITADAGADITITEGESVTLTASGGDTYLWSTGEKTQSITVRPDQTIGYTVTVYKGSCEDTDSVQVTVKQNDTSPPPAKANAGEDVSICLGESVTLTASGGKTYKWSTGETTRSITVNPTRTTTYRVTATRGGTTNSDDVIVTVKNCSALVEDPSLQENMSVYPNPSNGTINVRAENNYDSLNMDIYSINGSLVLKDQVQTKNKVAYKTVDLSRLSKGVYVVRMYNLTFNKIKKIVLK